jgi:hypothetical protein
LKAGLAAQRDRHRRRAHSSAGLATLPSLIGETDADGDGVRDSQDDCPNTPPGSVVSAEGCRIDQLVPRAGPASGGTWKNHGEYVSRTAHVADTFLAAGLITEDEKYTTVGASGQSKCGARGR